MCIRDRMRELEARKLEHTISTLRDQLAVAEAQATQARVERGEAETNLEQAVARAVAEGEQKEAELVALELQCKAQLAQAEDEVGALERRLQEAIAAKDEAVVAEEEAIAEKDEAVAAKAQSDQAVASSQEAFDKCQEALDLTQQALAHAQHQAEGLQEALDGAERRCQELELQLTDVDPEENQRLATDLEQALELLEQTQGDNDGLHQKLVQADQRALLKASELSERVQLLEQENHGLRKKLVVSEQKLEDTLASPELTGPVPDSADSSPDKEHLHNLERVERELRRELAQANSALQASKRELTSISRSSTPTRVRSTGSEELAKARLQQELVRAREELDVASHSPKGKPLPDKTQVILEGVLNKQGRFTSNPRYCMLDGNYFRIYDQKGQVKPKYVVPLRRLKTVQRSGENGFNVVHLDGEPISLEAHDKAYANRWLAGFQQARSVNLADQPLMPSTPDQLQPAGQVQRSSHPIDEIQASFSEQVLLARGHPIRSLRELDPGQVRVAEANLWIGWRDRNGEECTEARTVLMVVAAGCSGSCLLYTSPSPRDS
eukprot:TRINITY_DN44283_c0_g1_i1.p1 TRINITY_DN44283_c0_g1~~TRINITY_DN44283_c0_g1_i1.p1  ORF type:complete len:554 (+),score=177.98 TRINITY_DN44283_c0_g1_i1:119-1780(+)